MTTPRLWLPAPRSRQANKKNKECACANRSEKMTRKNAQKDDAMKSVCRVLYLRTNTKRNNNVTTSPRQVCKLMDFTGIFGQDRPTTNSGPSQPESSAPQLSAALRPFAAVLRLDPAVRSSLPCRLWSVPAAVCLQGAVQRGSATTDAPLLQVCHRTPSRRAQVCHLGIACAFLALLFSRPLRHVLLQRPLLKCFLRQDA